MNEGLTILSFTLLLIFVLWLIDKHGLWRRAFKVVLWVAALGALGLTVLYSWSKYEAHKEDARLKAAAQRDAAAAKAEAAASQAKLEACLARMKAASPKWNILDEIDANKVCTANPDVPAVNLDALPPNVTVSDTGQIVAWTPVKPPKVTRLRAEYDSVLTTAELSSLECGQVSTGEVVTLLQEDTLGVKVKKSDGRIGWASSSTFEVLH